MSENRRRGLEQREYEIEDTGVFDEGRYFDVSVEYAKAAPEDICIRVTVANRGPERATMHLLPTLWFRNTWSWGAADAPKRPMLRLAAVSKVSASHETLGDYHFAWHGEAEPLFTENETNAARIWQLPIRRPTLRTPFTNSL